MELLQTEDFYILNKNQDSLWFDKRSGSHECKTCWDMAAAKNPTCLGVVHALLGKIQILPDVCPRLVLVTGIKEVGNLETRSGVKSMVYCITRVVFLPLTTTPDFELNLQSCHKHHTQHPNSVIQDRKNILPFGDFQQKVGLSKTFGTIRNVTSSIKTATVNVAATATGQNKNKRESRDKERFERRILDELIKMFNESESFYYCNDTDLTSSLQRQNEPFYDTSLPLWKRADDRFFWNRYMLEPFQNGDKPVPDCWLIPIIQGFIQIESVPLESGTSSPMPSDALMAKDLKGDTAYILILISRRSRNRAGTRYKRRGVDEEGNVANYVETEQIMKFSHHQVAFVQVRGSVPLFWSQPGYKYRPPPRLDKDSEETAFAFKKHFEREIEIYDKVVCISLIEQIGKEKVIADEYLNHIMLLDSPALTFVSFDFHEYCRGMRYENVAVLVEGIEDIINSMLYSWVDKEGVICHQTGVFRVNCIDCLDRTNVVQTALGKAVLENQFAKLGIIPPEHPLPRECRLKLQVMWANNGDTISKQYAGTSALKGDFTCTGERNFAGLMKDGMNSANRYYRNHFHDNIRQAAIDILQFGEVTKESWLEISFLETVANVAGALIPLSPPQYMTDIALGPEKELAKAALALSRYYLNRFKDAYRQATIDTMLGLPVSEDLLSLTPDAAAAEEEEASLAQHVKHVIDDCKKLLVPDAETILGAWGLIDADPTSGDTEQTDMDIILVLTRDSYYVAQYDEEADRIMRYERVSLIDLDRIELGPYTFQGMFKQSKTFFCIRFNYQVEGQPGFFHMFRSMNIRFFNNMAVTIKTEEEIIESVKAIGDTFEVAAQMIGCEVELQKGRLERRKSRGRTNPANPFHLLSPITSFTKTSPDSLKNAGTRAFSNMTSGLAKLNPMSSLRLKRPGSQDQPSSESSTFYTQPVVAVSEATAPLAKNDLYLRSCGLIISSSPNLTKQALHSCASSLPLARTFSDSHLTASGHSTLPSHFRSTTPEILVSGEIGATSHPGSRIHPLPTGCLLSVNSGRVRKLSHSSDEVDTREDSDGGVADLIPRASSATKLDLDLSEGEPEGSRFLPGLFFGSSSSRTSLHTQSPLTSPLAALQRETVLAPFSVLARGVQSLAPGRIAKGVQSIGANLDPRKLKAQRQKQLEEDLEMKERKLKCQSRIIQL